MTNLTPKLPEVTFNKSGYEIRTEVLGMAKDLEMQEFTAKFQGWQMTVEKDAKSGQIVTNVDMPAFPGLEQILETAGKLYQFVNGAGNMKSTKKTT